MFNWLLVKIENRELWKHKQRIYSLTGYISSQSGYILGNSWVAVLTETQGFFIKSAMIGKVDSLSLIRKPILMNKGPKTSI